MRSETVEIVYTTIIFLCTGTLFLSVFIDILTGRGLVAEVLLLLLRGSSTNSRSSVFIVILRLTFRTLSSTTATTAATAASSTASITTSTTPVSGGLDGVRSAVGIKFCSGKQSFVVLFDIKKRDALRF